MALITVLLADDHPVMRAGIRRLLDAEPDLDVVAEAASGQRALALARQHAPDVLVLDMEMPNGSGVDVARALHGEAPGTRILALSAYNRRGYVEGLLRLGAAGYITKDKPPAMIVEAIRAVARGEGRWFVTPPAAPRGGDLTGREQEVLRLLADGQSHDTIAEQLHIARNTVRNHLASIYDKLGVHAAHEAVAWAWKHGLAHDPDA
jgi:DNA-binding NarL/FixJ family response regulator